MPACLSLLSNFGLVVPHSHQANVYSVTVHPVTCPDALMFLQAIPMEGMQEQR